MELEVIIARAGHPDAWGDISPQTVAMRVEVDEQQAQQLRTAIANGWRVSMGVEGSTVCSDHYNLNGHLTLTEDSMRKLADLPFL